MMLLLTVLLITLHSGKERVDINADSITTTRKPERSETYFHPETRCLLTMANGKIVSVTESCDEVKDSIRDAKREDKH